MLPLQAPYPVMAPQPPAPLDASVRDADDGNSADDDDVDGCSPLEAAGADDEDGSDDDEDTAEDAPPLLDDEDDDEPAESSSSPRVQAAAEANSARASKVKRQVMETPAAELGRPADRSNLAVRRGDFRPPGRRDPRRAGPDVAGGNNRDGTAIQ